MNRTEAQEYWLEVARFATCCEKEYFIGTDYAGSIDWEAVWSFSNAKITRGLKSNYFSSLEALIPRARYRLIASMAVFLARTKYPPKPTPSHSDPRHGCIMMTRANKFPRSVEIALAKSLIVEDLELI